MPGEAAVAAELYSLSPYGVAPALIRSVALVKEAAASCNGTLGYLDVDVSSAIIERARSLRSLTDREIESAFPLDAYQGGAGTSTNMAVNEWIAGPVAILDPHDHVNLHQSTNDVMPTALRLMMHDALLLLEERCQELQGMLQEGEQAYDPILKVGRTQLRDALVTTVGREFGTWAHAIARDRWRAFKARERIREVNLGGTAIGSGAGAPRDYVLSVVRHLQELVDHPITRAEHLTEATSNYDSITEAMSAPKCLAVNLRRVAGDIRLLASGPESAIGEIGIPAVVRGSSIMAGKTNPVVAEAVIQCAERIMANDGLLSRLASMSELELNAFFPAIAHTVYESLTLAERAAASLAGYLGACVPDHIRCARGLSESHADAVALLPLVGYELCEELIGAARSEGVSLRELLRSHELITTDDAEQLFAPENLTALGYDRDLYESLQRTCGDAIRAFTESSGSSTGREGV